MRCKMIRRQYVYHHLKTKSLHNLPCVSTIHTKVWYVPSQDDRHTSVFSCPRNWVPFCSFVWSWREKEEDDDIEANNENRRNGKNFNQYDGIVNWITTSKQRYNFINTYNSKISLFHSQYRQYSSPGWRRV